MAGRNYERLAIEQFGRHLFESNDLDPIYNALWKINRIENGWGNPQLYRWLLAYWCFYHSGVASYISQFQSQQYWDMMLVAAKNEAPSPTGQRWPRGHERRHFRGGQAIQAISELAARYPSPEWMVEYVAGEGGQYEALANRVQEHRGFGPWISWKVADMTDRVLGLSIDFKEKEVFMFTDPTKAALMLWRQRMKLPEGTRPKDNAAQATIIHAIVEYLQLEFANYKAPPDYRRIVNLQEIETVLCKWKSHMNGHYPLWNDIMDIRSGLEPWAKVCKEAASFLQYVPRKVE